MSKEPLAWASRVLPPGWDTARLKHLAAMNVETLPESSDPDLLFDYVDIGSVDALGHIGGTELIRFAEAPSRARRVLRGGDILISTVRTYLRAIAQVPDTEGYVSSTGFAVVSPKREIVDERFIYWWLRSDPFVEQVVAESVGVSYPAIKASDIARMLVPVPSSSEQRGVADYLDAECSRMEDLTRELIDLSTLTSEHEFAAVSALLGCTDRHGDGSAWAWLGPCPPSWRLTPLKRLATIQSGLTLGKTYDEPVQSFPYLRVANVKNGEIDVEQVSEVDVPIEVAERHRLSAGDVLMTEGGTTISSDAGRSGMVALRTVCIKTTSSRSERINVLFLRITLPPSSGLPTGVPISRAQPFRRRIWLQRIVPRWVPFRSRFLRPVFSDRS